MAKKRKSLLPKRIAGVKVPKAVRKGRLGELLASQTGQALLAEAVVAAGALGGMKKVGDAAAEKSSGGGMQDFAEQVSHRLKHAGGKDAAASGALLAVALGEAARAFVKAMNDHHRPAEPAEPQWRDPDEADDEGSKKKPNSSDSLPH